MSLSLSRSPSLVDVKNRYSESQTVSLCRSWLIVHLPWGVICRGVMSLAPVSGDAVTAWIACGASRSDTEFFIFNNICVWREGPGPSLAPAGGKRLCVCVRALSVTASGPSRLHPPSCGQTPLFRPWPPNSEQACTARPAQTNGARGLDDLAVGTFPQTDIGLYDIRTTLVGGSKRNP